MNKVTGDLLLTLRRAEGFAELVASTVLPQATKALRILIEEEVEEKSLPASCANALGDDSGVDWDALTRAILTRL